MHALWHLEFKDGPLLVLKKAGTREHPQLFGALDNRSRPGCHLQWYLGESADELTHGFGRGMQKRGKPRAVMMANGPAMNAGETRQGLIDLGIELCQIPDYIAPSTTRSSNPSGSRSGATRKKDEHRAR